MEMFASNEHIFLPAVFLDINSAGDSSFGLQPCADLPTLICHRQLFQSLGNFYLRPGAALILAADDRAGRARGRGPVSLRL